MPNDLRWGWCNNNRNEWKKVKVKPLSRVQLCTLWNAAYQAPLSMGFSRQSTGVGYHFLLQGIFPTQGSNSGLPHCKQTLYHLSHHDTSKVPSRRNVLQSSQTHPILPGFMEKLPSTKWVPGTRKVGDRCLRAFSTFHWGWRQSQMSCGPCMFYLPVSQVHCHDTNCWSGLSLCLYAPHLPVYSSSVTPTAESEMKVTLRCEVSDEAVSLLQLRYLSRCSKTHDFPWNMILPLSKGVNPADTRTRVIE